MVSHLDVCEKAVRLAGAVLVEMLGQVTVKEKGPADLVTEADHASQETVRRTVLAAFPGHDFLGEEDGPGEPAKAGAAFRWILDPLDGTTNYVHQVPHFCVSLALAYQSKVVCAAIFDPLLEECFTAELGKGAYCNGRRIRTSGVQRLGGALAAVGFPAVVKRDSPDLRLFAEAAVCCQAMRRMGSAALNLAYVACGRFDLAWSFTTKVWDIAAGKLLIEEAGGKMTRMDGSTMPLAHGPFLASASGVLHQQALAMVARAGVLTYK